MAKSLEERVFSFDEEMKKQDGYKVRYIDDATVLITSYMVTFLRGDAENLVDNVNIPCPQWIEPERLISRRKAEDEKYMVAIRGITQKKIKQSPAVQSDVCCMGDLMPKTYVVDGSSRVDIELRRNIVEIKDTFCQKSFLLSVVSLFPKAYFTCTGTRELIHWLDEATDSDGFICPYLMPKKVEE